LAAGKLGVSMREDAKVREAVAVMENVDSLETAVEELREAGFAADAISLLAGHATVERKLGRMYERVEDLEDDPAAPRTAFVSSRTVERREGMIMGSMTTLPTLIAAGTVVASAGAVAAAIAGTAVTGALIGKVLASWMDKRHATWLEEQLERGGILLWVRTADEAEARLALEILGRYAAHDIHIHEIPTIQA
jgi:outer membrane lipoprotein SlyB